MGKKEVNIVWMEMINICKKKTKLLLTSDIPAYLYFKRNLALFFFRLQVNPLIITCHFILKQSVCDAVFFQVLLQHST